MAPPERHGLVREAVIGLGALVLGVLAVLVALALCAGLGIGAALLAHHYRPRQPVVPTAVAVSLFLFVVTGVSLRGPAMRRMRASKSLSGRADGQSFLTGWWKAEQWPTAPSQGRGDVELDEPPAPLESSAESSNRSDPAGVAGGPQRTESSER